VIPGTKKPTLFKAGAELLDTIYGLRADFIPTVDLGDGETVPHIRVSMRAELHLGDLAGPVVAVGYGAANSWEVKHRYRREERTCPECGNEGTVIKGKQEYGGGWLCWTKKPGGCGAKFAEDAPEIVGQVVENAQNPDPFDLENTLVKMAEKRAFVDVTLRATASSDLFTQDVDMGRGQGDPPPSERTPAPAAFDKSQPKAEGQPKPSQGLNELIWEAAKLVAEGGGVADAAEAIGRASVFFGKKHPRKGEDIDDQERWESDVLLESDVMSFRDPAKTRSEKWRKGALRNLQARLGG
jgi:hypothetical protein